MSRETIGCFSVAIDSDGIALVTFDRPPVNAVSIQVYQALSQLADRAERGGDIRVLVLAAPDHARAWCGGADLHDFVGIDRSGRVERYALINQVLPRFYAMQRPVIAAIGGATIGVGMILAALCDLRIAAEEAVFSCPEIDYGLVAGSAGLFARLNMPEAKVREMLFTGARFTARELEPTGFFNAVVPRAELIERAMAMARLIAAKSLPAIVARKIASSQLEGLSWTDAYLDAQRLSGELTSGQDGSEGVDAFLDRRQAQIEDR